MTVVGGGPAGSLFSYFLLRLARVADLDVGVDVYESRDFSRAGPAGCNMCGGIISESLVQILAAEGINLPPTVVRRGIDAYVLHTSAGDARIETPLHEKRIAAVYRGGGPRGAQTTDWQSFDEYLVGLATAMGAELVRRRVDRVVWKDARPHVQTRSGPARSYDLLVVATGINTSALKLSDGLKLAYRPPKTVRTHIREFGLDKGLVERYLGSAMHIFLPDLAGLEFAALVPKGDYATLCILGTEIDEALVRRLLDGPEMKRCLPAEYRQVQALCRCSPRINITGAARPFADRIVFVGDCGVTRLYKDGIGAAYRTAKAAAATAIFQGISAEDFRRHYWPVCRAIEADNRIGKVIFALTDILMKIRPAQRGVLRMVAREQRPEVRRRPMSLVLWDIFTGSAAYWEVFMQTVRPSFVAHLLWNMAVEAWRLVRRTGQKVTS